jgi:hypothetical protein
VAHLQSGGPAAIFYPFGHPTPYAYAMMLEDQRREKEKDDHQRRFELQQI